MIFGIILLAIAAILLVWFVAWFIITRVICNCPLCYMEKIAHPSKLTIDTTDAPNYGGATVPPMGWSSWNTFRQNINQDLILEVAEAGLQLYQPGRLLAQLRARRNGSPARGFGHLLYGDPGADQATEQPGL